MRRLSIALVPAALMGMLAAGGAVVAEARAPSPVVDAGAAWIVAKGAAAEASFSVTCSPGDGPMVLDAALAEDEFTADTRATGTVYDVSCTGEPVEVVVPLRPWSGPLDPGFWVVRYELTNCIERGECDTVTGRRHRELERQRFVTPYDDDVAAELALVRARLTQAGNLRMVYDLTCDSVLGMPTTLETTVWQVQRGAFVGGYGYVDHGGAGGIDCHPDTRRLRYTVAAHDGLRFRPRQAFVDSFYGQWHEWGQYATDRRPIRIEASAR